MNRVGGSFPSRSPAIAISYDPALATATAAVGAAGSASEGNRANREAESSAKSTGKVGLRAHGGGRWGPPSATTPSATTTCRTKWFASSIPQAASPHHERPSLATARTVKVWPLFAVCKVAVTVALSPTVKILAIHSAGGRYEGCRMRSTRVPTAAISLRVSSPARTNRVKEWLDWC